MGYGRHYQQRIYDPGRYFTVKGSGRRAMMTPEEHAKEVLGDGHYLRAWGLEHAIAERIRQAQREALEEAAQHCDENPQDAACELAKHFRALMEKIE